MATKNLFAPVPLRAMAVELSGLQMRVLTCVAAHDRMSLAKGKGQGCRASNERMREMIGCSYGKLCASLNELVDTGLLQREKVGRHTIYRVVYNADDVCLFGHTNGPSKGDRTVQSPDAICDHDYSESRGKAGENTPQYIPLNGGIDFVETKGRNSDNRRVVSDAGRSGVRFQRQLPANLWKLPAPAAIAIIERAFASVGRQVDEIPKPLQRPLTRWLFQQADELGDQPSGQQAMRLCEEISVW